MKQLISFFIIIYLGSYSSNAQMVKFIKNQYQSKYRVYITENPKEANQWIYKVKGPTDIRKPGEWYVVPNPQLFIEAVTLYKVKNKEEADLIVYYVSTRDSAKIIQ